MPNILKGFGFSLGLFRIWILIVEDPEPSDRLKMSGSGSSSDLDAIVLETFLHAPLTKIYERISKLFENLSNFSAPLGRLKVLILDGYSEHDAHA